LYTVFTYLGIGTAICKKKNKDNDIEPKCSHRMV
jgi:hypothetical protein